VERHRTIGLAAHELTHLGHRTRVEFGRRALGGDLAARQQVAVMGDARELADVVRDDDAGDAERLVQRADQAHDDAHRDRVEAHEGLVVDQEFRIHDDRACERHAARHAARELRGHQVRGAAQADGVQLGQHQVAQHRLRQAHMLAHREGDVLEHRQVGEQRPVLEQHAHAPTQAVERGGAEVLHLLPEDLDAAAGREHLTRDEAQQCGLAGAARAHHGRDPAATRLEVDTGEDGAGTDAVVQVTDPDDGVGRSRGCAPFRHPQAAFVSMSAV
jgi:hypothetical protein